MSDPGKESGPGTARLQVLLAEASPAIRSQLRAELKSLPFVEIVGEANTKDEALAIFFRSRPEVVLVSALLPDQGGFEVLRCIVRSASESVVILTSLSPNPFTEAAARLLGAAGICPLSGGLTDLHYLLRNLWARRVQGKS